MIAAWKSISLTPRLRLPAGLPRLAGRNFQIFRIVWIAALIGAIAGIGIGEVYTYQRTAVTAPSFAAFGLHVGVEVPVQFYFPLNAATRAAGVATGDAPLAINGRAIAPDARPQDIAPMLDAAGAEAIVRTRAKDGRVADHLLRRDPHGADQTFAGSGMSLAGYDIAMRVYDTLVALMMLAAAILLFVRRPRDSVAAFLSLAFLLLLASYSWTWLIEIAHERMIVAVLRPTAWCMMNAVLLAFPTGRFQPRWSAGAALALVPVWLVWIGGMPLSSVALANMVMLVLAILSIRARYRTMANLLERQQIKWALLGFSGGAAALVLVILSTVVVPLYTANFHVLIWAEAVRFFATITMVACFPLGLLVSLLRYRLYDADAIISRSAAYALLMVMIGALWAGGERGIERIVEVSLGHEAGTSAAFLAAALATALVAPAHNRIHHWAEKRFQKALLHLRHGLPAFVEDMRETAHVHELLEETLDRIEKGVRAVRGAVLLGHEYAFDIAAVRDVEEARVAAWRISWRPDYQHPLDCDREDPLFPLRLRLDGERGTLGWVLLGPRPDGSFYGKDERDALTEVAEPIARAIIVSRRREARWGAVHSAIDALAGRIASIESRLVALGKPARRNTR